VVGNVGRMALARWKDLCLDATDPRPVAEFWAAVLGLEVQHRDDGVTRLAGDPVGRTTWVNPVAEPKTVKNRMHWDVTLVADTPDDLLAAGATLLRQRGHDGIGWWIMADPEGNEFCAFAPKAR
jgi:hypothetical protein